MTFFSPWMAWAGLALAAAPILIHLLNRRRFKVVPWAAMDFLLAAVKRNRRRLQFERWLLLAMRCGVLILLGLALARPMGCSGKASWASWAGAESAQGRGLNVILLDNSYSMGYEADRPHAKTHLDQAKRLAEALIDRLAAGGQSVALITASHPATAVLSPATFDLDQARAAVERVDLSADDTDIPGALQKAIDLAGQSNEPNKRLFIFTDAARSAWEGENGAVGQAIQRLGPEVARRYRIALFHLGLERQSNQAVVELKPLAQLATQTHDGEFQIAVAGFGEAADAQVQLTLEGRPAGSIPISNLQGIKQATSPPIHFDRAGPQVLTARLSPSPSDRLEIDNRRHHVVDVVSKLKVLLVEGERGLSSMSGSAAFLKLALAPSAPQGSQTQAGDIDPTVISDLELPNQVLSDYRAILMTDVARIGSSEAGRLHRFVEQGGALLWFMGNQVDADRYNQELLPLGLMPGTLTHQVAAGASSDGFLFDFNPNGAVDPYLSVFKNQPKSGLGAARVFTYWQMHPVPKWHARRILNYRLPASAQAGAAPDPAITVHSLGDGHVLFFSTTANADWTSLPAKPAYVALMNELLAHAITPPGRWMNLDVGQRLTVPASVELSTAPVLRDPHHRRVALTQTTINGQTRYQSPPLPQAGVYQLETGDRNYPVAVNPPAAWEADVRPLNEAAIRKALGDVPVDIHGDALPSAAVQSGQAADWSRPLMVALLVLIALEAVMAMRSGHYRQAGAFSSRRG